MIVDESPAGTGSCGTGYNSVDGARIAVSRAFWFSRRLLEATPIRSVDIYALGVSTIG